MSNETVQEPAGEGASTTGHRPSEDQTGVIIGPYKLLQKLGEGGMGTVWMAEQTVPVRRRVALKIIKAGMDSRQVVARFEAERQALALMDHPNIAKVHDGGTTSAGLPYFVMELVKGLPITQLCDQERLATRERLALFVSVCQAVQHAHQKGVIHRDLKPSNVLVALCDGKPVAKVIDFGVAKATEQRLSQHTLFTEAGQIVGTLEYMAPEQAELSNLDIDTRADIYSLGVLLYELLAGSPPFSRRQLKGAALDEMLRIIREVEPPKPSTRLSSSEQKGEIAASRSLDPGKLARLMKGDLDWIVMKCLEKDRGRRYETATGLAADLRRFLADEPVLAGPPTLRYRLGKYLRRHRKAALAASAFALLLASAAIGGVLLAWRADDERARAVLAEGEAKANLAQAQDSAEAERKANTLAEARRLQAVQSEEEAKIRRKEAEAAKEKAVEEAAIARTLTEILHLGGEFLIVPDEDGGGFEGTFGERKGLLLSQVVDHAVKRLDKRKDLRPAVVNAVRSTLARTYVTVGEFANGMKQYDIVLAHQRKNLGSDHADTLATLSAMGGEHVNEKNYPKAELLLLEAARGLKKHEAQSPTKDKAALRQCLDRLAQLYASWGKPQEAERWRKEWEAADPKGMRK